MKTEIALLLFILAFSNCKKEGSDVELPSRDFFYSNPSISFSQDTRKATEGVYLVKKGMDFLGSQVVIKWSGNYFSIFTGKNSVYLVFKTFIRDSAIILDGYWRGAQSFNYGKAFLNIKADEGAQELLNSSRREKTIIRGFYGHNNENPSKEIVLEFDHSLSVTNQKFWIIAHRGGGRNVDKLPASENSLAIIKNAEAFGANSIEIDVQQTKDSVLVLFHDENMSKRLINQELFIGKVSDYTFPQIQTYCTLKDGQKIPTLMEALETVIDSTELNLVWLDIKEKGMMKKVADIQYYYTNYAKTKGRDIEILIGLPDKNMLEEYLKLTNLTNHPALCEFYNDNLETVNSIVVWSPRWSLGLQNENINSIHQINKRAFVWTIDQSSLIKAFLNESHFDGILSNYPSVIAYEYYSKK